MREGGDDCASGWGCGGGRIGGFVDVVLIVGRGMGLRGGCGLTRGGGDKKVGAWTTTKGGEGCGMGERGDRERGVKGGHL